MPDRTLLALSDMRAMAILPLLFGCGAKSTVDPSRIRPPDDMGEVPGENGAPPAEDPPGVDPEVSFWLQLGRIDSADLLFMVDDSNSMREEQANLTANFPSLLEALTVPPDANGDGSPDWTAVGSLHVGVISSDMGTSGYPVTTCDNAQRGDDGVLQNLPSPSIVGCDAAYPKFLTYDVAAPDANLAHEFECISTLGTGGCGFEQQLYAVEKALTVHAQPGAANDGFLRADALLGVVIITDEEDCSISDPAIFGDDDSLGPLGLRCFNNPEMIRPVDEFVTNLLAIKPGRPDRIVVAGITGVPPDLVQLTDEDLASGDIMSTRDFEDLLNDPRMTETVDYSPEGGGNRLVPSCDVPGLGIAFPPRRIVQLIRDVDAEGNGGIVQSICQADWRPTMRAISTAIARHLDAPACTSAALEDASGHEVAAGSVVNCAVYESRYDQSPCGAGALDRGIVDGARVCQICQRGEGGAGATDAFGLDVSSCSSADGWSYVPDAANCPTGGLVDFSPGTAPDPTSPVYLECLWPAA